MKLIATFACWATLCSCFGVVSSLAFTTAPITSLSVFPSCPRTLPTTKSSSSSTTARSRSKHCQSQQTSFLFAASSRKNDDNHSCNIDGGGRRQFLSSSSTTLSLLLLFARPNLAMAGSLLEDYGGSDPSKLVQPKKVEEEYTGSKKGENAIDPSLRASYYFPTARKRYLPRIQKVSNQLKLLAPTTFSTSSNEWLEEIQSLYNTAENAILPMKLYTSSLDGQGLRMTQSGFVKTMKSDIDKYERQVQVLSKALAKQDKTLAQTAVQELSDALTDFRAAGRLTEDIEDLPSVDEIRRMTMRRPTMKFAQY